MSDESPSWVHVANRDELEAFYRGILPKLCVAAKGCGYALGVHGSMRRDLDLIAVPWDTARFDKDILAKAIQRAACGIVSAKYQWEEKPLGRFAASFPVCWPEWHDELSLGHIDLSVMEVKAMAEGQTPT